MPPQVTGFEGTGLNGQDFNSSSATARNGYAHAAAAAEHPSNGEENKGATTRRPAIQGSFPAQQPSAADEKTVSTKALRQRGLSRELAEEHAHGHSAESLRQIVALYDRELKAGNVRKPIAGLIGILKNPAKWGLERDQDGDWRMTAEVEAKDPFDAALFAGLQKFAQAHGVIS
jgi:hypothetical protein